MPARPFVAHHRALARGSALIFALAIVLLLTVAGVALISLTGNDRIDAAKLAKKDRGLACAEAGLQYARRFFGSRYATSNNWNDYLVAPTSAAPGFRYDAAAGDWRPNLANVPPETRGKSNGSDFDPGTDLDNDGQPDFWVSVHDNDDERPLGIATNDPARDNDELIIIRSECTNPAWTVTSGGTARNVVLESALSHVQGSSGYGIASGGSNSPDLVGNL